MKSSEASSLELAKEEQKEEYINKVKEARVPSFWFRFPAFSSFHKDGGWQQSFD